MVVVAGGCCSGRGRSSRSSYARAKSSKDIDANQGWLRRFAAWKGLQSLNEYLDRVDLYGRCSYLYCQYEQCMITERGDAVCGTWRDDLVSECNAVWDGSSLEFTSIKPRPCKKQVLAEYERMKREAASAGFTDLQEYYRHIALQDECKILARCYNRCLKDPKSIELGICEMWKTKLSETCEGLMNDR